MVVSLSPVRQPVTVLPLTVTLSGVALVPNTPMPYALPFFPAVVWMFFTVLLSMLIPVPLPAMRIPAGTSAALDVL